MRLSQQASQNFFVVSLPFGDALGDTSHFEEEFLVVLQKMFPFIHQLPIKLRVHCLSSVAVSIVYDSFSFKHKVVIPAPKRQVEIERNP